MLMLGEVIRFEIINGQKVTGSLVSEGMLNLAYITIVGEDGIPALNERLFPSVESAEAGIHEAFEAMKAGTQAP